MPAKSAAQHRLMEAAAHTPGGFGGVPQAVGREFVKGDDASILNEVEFRLMALNDHLDDMMPARRDASHADVVGRIDALFRRSRGGEGRADAGEWDESKHPRAEDGKFGSGSGSAKSGKYSPKVAGSVAEYKSATKGKKVTASGLIQHLLKEGHHEHDIYEAAMEHAGLAPDKKGYVKWYYSDLKKKGVQVPDLLKGASHEATVQAIKEMKLGVPKAEAPKVAPPGYPPAKAAPAAAKAGSAPVLDTKSWTKIGGQLGSNPGGKYKDASGQEWYGKQSKSADHAKNEVLASKLYQAAGAPVVDSDLADFDGKLGTATKWQAKQGNVNPESAEDRAQAAKNFAVHAWLANWDAAGLSFDNQAKINGKLTTMDVGGALKYRAQGEEKTNWGASVGEWNTLRDPKISKQNAELFSGMSDEELKASAQAVVNVSDAKIIELVNEFGPGDANAKEDMVDTLIKRKADLAERAGIPNVPNQEFEGKHDRNPDGTFKKGAEEAKPAEKPKAAEEETHKQSLKGQYPHKAVQVVEKFGPKLDAKGKELLAKAINVKTDYPNTIFGNLDALASAGEPGDIKFNDIAPLKDGGFDTTEDPGKKAFNEFLAHVKANPPKPSAAAPAETPKPAPAAPSAPQPHPKSIAGLSQWKTNYLKVAVGEQLDDHGKQLLQKVLNAETTVNKSLDAKLSALKSTWGPQPEPYPAGTKDPGKKAFNELLAYKKGGKMGAPTSAAPKPAAPPPAPPAKKLGSTNQLLGKQIEEAIPNMLPKNKLAVEQKMQQIKDALNKPTHEEQKAALAAVEKFPDHSGMGKDSVNNYLKSVKEELGADTPSSTSKPSTAPSPEAIKKTYEAIKAAPPPAALDHKTKLENAEGKKVTAHLKADTDHILGDHYAKVTAAYAGDPANSLSHEVDTATEAYAKATRAQMSSAEVDALNDYQDGVYKHLNKAMNGRAEHTASSKKCLDGMREAFKHEFNVIPADTPAFRGINASIEDISGFADEGKAIGRCFLHKNFASISRSHKTSYGFSSGHTLMKMTIPAGTKAITMPGQNGSERETVLNEASMWRIDKITHNELMHKNVIHCTFIGYKVDS
jgi:hypothetical protein